MSEIVSIERKIFGKNSFQNVVNTNFTQLITPTTGQEVISDLTPDAFFQQYNSIFYNLPYSGSNSHLDLVNRSSEYLGISLLDISEELRQVRAENVSLKNQLLTITNQTK